MLPKRKFMLKKGPKGVLISILPPAERYAPGGTHHHLCTGDGRHWFVDTLRFPGWATPHTGSFCPSCKGKTPPTP